MIVVPYIEVDTLLPFVAHLLGTRKDPRRSLVGELERRNCLDIVFGDRVVVVDRLQQSWSEMWIAWEAQRSDRVTIRRVSE